jgi:hypothetical protein
MSSTRGSRGAIETFGPEGSTLIETFTCCHCSAVFRKPGRSDPAGFCELCFLPTCLKPSCNDHCDPFEKKIERMEAVDVQRRKLAEQL